EVGQRGQMRAECAWTEGDHTLARRNGVDVGTDGGHDTHAFATDHRRIAVQAGVDAHGLDDVAEVESGCGDTDLDLIGLGCRPLDRMHGQCVQAAGLIDLQPYRAATVEVYGCAAWF